MCEPEFLKNVFVLFYLIFNIFRNFFVEKNKYFLSKNLFQNSSSRTPCVLVSFKPVLIFIKIKWRLICKMAFAAMIVIFWSCLLSTAGSTCNIHGSSCHVFYKVDNYITFNLIIRFHQLKCPGKEIIKATTWGPRHNNLPRLVALNFPCVNQL